MNESSPGQKSGDFPAAATSAQGIVRWRIQVTGVVQGIGFRPFVYRLARKHGLRGWVLNASDGVTLEIQGNHDQIRRFWEDFLHRRPPGVVYETLRRTEVPPVELEKSLFQILPSQKGGEREPTIPADLATCAECLAELHDHSDRRYRYPFINCTHCGPRWSIIEGVPYDRPLTSMKIFPMCSECEREYHDPANRRFHAQPVACPACGPQVELWSVSRELLSRGEDAIRQAAEAVKRGQILALKGLGGFQLVCDASNEEAVETLRRRKRRPHKPFALMITKKMLQAVCEEPSPLVWRWLTSPAAPIVLIPRRGMAVSKRTFSPLGFPTKEKLNSEMDPGTSASQDTAANEPEVRIAEAVAPGNPYLGVMLPYTPLHHLLMEAVSRPVVCTSGNLSEEPMAIENEEACERLSKIADLFLVHNRPIVRPVDDSVMAEGAEGDIFLIRRARGFAPRPFRLAQEGPIVLATGGHLKNVVGLALPKQAVLSAHIGDLDNVLAWEAHRRAVEDLLRFFQRVPEAVACDLHPDYASTRVAEELADRLRVPLFRWQHHVAHFAAGLAEWETPRSDPAFDGIMGEEEITAEDHAFFDHPRPQATPPELPLLGVIWDGTGYGIDGTVWGGEFFLYDGRSFQRLAHLRRFPLPGGEIVVRQPRRSLLGLLTECGRAEEESRDPRGVLRSFFTESELRLLLRSLARRIQAPQTSSMGRLFDGVAALLGFGPQISFEGQAAMALQFAAEKALLHGLGDESSRGPQTPHRDLCPAEGSGIIQAAPLVLRERNPLIVDWQPLLESLLLAIREGVPRERLALEFHRQLAKVVLTVAERLHVRGLMCSGGCFQNQLLRRLLRNECRARNLPVWFSQRLPPGDGGLALGQIWLTRRTIQGALHPGRAGVSENSQIR